MKELRFNTLAEFKRQAVKGAYIRGGYYGKRQDEWREVGGVQSNGLRLKTQYEKGIDWSFFDYPKARDCEIEQEADGSVLKIYQERVRFGNSDIPADISWFKYDLERGAIKENEVERYRKQVAEYRVGVADE